MPLILGIAGPMSGRWPLLIQALLVVGCGADAPAPPFSARDSAGVRVVENRRPVWDDSARAWTVRAEPVLDLGGVGAPEARQFDGIAGALRTGDGGLVVADWGSRELRFFDGAGELVRRVGREGGGPGEFRGIGGLVEDGDSLLVWDPRELRLTILGLDGNLKSMRSLKELSAGPLRIYKPIGLLRGGVVFFKNGSAAPPPGRNMAYWDSTPNLWIGPGGGIDTLAGYAGLDMYAGERGWRRLPFGRWTVAAVHGGRFYISDTGDYEIRVHGESGELRSLIRRDFEPPALTEATLDGWLDRLFERAREAGASEEILDRERRFLYEEMDYPERLPALKQLVTDDVGHLWVQRYGTSPMIGSKVWDAFDPSGRWLGPVEMPRSMEVLEIGEDHVLGMWRDELDVEHVVMYALER